MLQQTQVDRVIPKYKSFLKQFPTAQSLARSSLASVLRQWQGLGYNRRAKYLHEAAKLWPKGETLRSGSQGFALEQLPGVGPYTANAVRVFAYNEPRVLIETNIRAVFIHHLFPKSKKVPDERLLPLIAVVAKNKNPREWYAALMDYGSYLKSTHPNPSRRSKHHTTQSKFKGSDREIRGAILRAVLNKQPLTKLPFDKKRVRAQIVALKKEGLI